MLKFVGAISIIIALIFGFIVSYQVTITAAPAYMGFWWTYFILTLVGYLFTLAGSLAGED